MLIPIKCFTCGKVLADLSEYYKRQVLEQKLKKLKSTEDLENTEYFTSQNVDKSIEGHMLDKLNIQRQCCRINIFTHVDIE
jgi:DNA-directed RNA polymerase I, II, and III subunit RPABC5